MMYVEFLDTSGEINCESAAIYVPDAKIQCAVDNASAGDTIIVRDGTYTENVDVDKPYLTIRSENGSDKMIVQAANHAFEITTNVNISGFAAKGATFIRE